MQCPGVVLLQLVLELSNSSLIAANYLFIADDILFGDLSFSLQLFDLLAYVLHFLVILFDLVVLIVKDHILFSSILLQQFLKVLNLNPQLADGLLLIFDFFLVVSPGRIDKRALAESRLLELVKFCILRSKLCAVVTNFILER